MERIITLNVCIGEFCKHKLIGCSINSVKTDCWRCRKQYNCDLARHASDYNYTFCQKCLQEKMKNEGSEMQMWQIDEKT